MEGPSKNWRMPLYAASTRYSLVKGERIVRFVLTARLRALSNRLRLDFIVGLLASVALLIRCGTNLPQRQLYEQKNKPFVSDI